MERRKAPQVVKSSFTYVRLSQPPSIGNRTAKIFLPHSIFQISPRNPPLLPSKRRRFPLPNSPVSPRKRKALPKAQNFRAHGRKFSYVRKFIFLRKKNWPPSNVDFSPSARRKIFVRTEENFLPQENLFPCGRKNIFLRKEIWASSEQKFCAVRKERNFRAHENKFPHMRKYFFVYTEINFLIYGNFTPCKPAGNAGHEKGHFLPLRRGLRQVGDRALLPYSTNLGVPAKLVGA